MFSNFLGQAKKSNISQFTNYLLFVPFYVFKLFGTGQKSFARGRFWPVPKNPIFLN